MEIRTTKEILLLDQDSYLDDNKEELSKKWISVDDLFKWAEDNPEDNFEDFLAAVDYKKYLEYEKK